jgi:hypothetical protein
LRDKTTAIASELEERACQLVDPVPSRDLAASSSRLVSRRDNPLPNVQVMSPELPADDRRSNGSGGTPRLNGLLPAMVTGHASGRDEMIAIISARAVARPLAFPAQ